MFSSGSFSCLKPATSKQLSERVINPNLWAEEIQTRIGIGLPAVRQMFIENSGAYIPTFVDLVGKTGRRQNVKCKILALPARNIGVTVDPTQAKTAGKIRNQARPWLNEVITQTEIESEIAVLDSLQNRFGNSAKIKLIVTAQPVIPLHNTPAHSCSDKFRRDLIILRWIKHAKQIARFN